MKRSVLLIAGVMVFAVAGIAFADNHESGQKPDVLAGTIEGLAVENILTSQLELAEGVEVVVSHIVVPPHTELPRHWHPGEEFAYVLDGSGVLLQEGQPDMPFRKGDVAKIPLKQVHTVRTADSPTTILVFRVHQSGQPVRVLVD